MRGKKEIFKLNAENFSKSKKVIAINWHIKDSLNYYFIF